eukprot:CAMPEP_0172029576 /NCGR_PEP_ID=MMETSP1041-20130122/18214_1 /TAXON_ID=464988 /ORGANISM="Hemiselmis andersenii, Strain CCMP439" /LENGTH=77 /DNA_ID=CAMNT_0012685767 /DNA_START=24 /DNA_END=257 /DNA_ORIENTATION=+
MYIIMYKNPIMCKSSRMYPASSYMQHQTRPDQRLHGAHWKTKSDQRLPNHIFQADSSRMVYAPWHKAQASAPPKTLA